MSRFERPSESGTSHNDDESLGFVNYLYWVLGTLGVASFLGFMVFGESETVDPQTNCGTNPAKHLAVLVDLSDPLASAQRASMLNRFTEISSPNKGDYGFALSKGDKLTVYFITESDTPELVFQQCSPGNVDEADRLNEAALIVQAKWRRFSEDMVRLIEQKTSTTSSLSTSYIVESLAYVRAKEFPPTDQVLNGGQKLDIVVISDFLQSSPLFSHYNTAPPSAQEVHKQFPVQLQGFEVNLFYVVNSAHRGKQDGKLVDWWREYISVAGGRNKGWREL